MSGRLSFTDGLGQFQYLDAGWPNMQRFSA